MTSNMVLQRPPAFLASLGRPLAAEHHDVGPTRTMPNLDFYAARPD